MTAASPAIVPELAADRQAIAQVVRAAFGKDAEARLIDRLREAGDVLLSLVARCGGQITGHMLFSRLQVGDHPSLPAVALAPLAVEPAWQRRGIGQALVRAGLERLRAQGESLVLVLGDPEYYGRFGFSAGAASHLESPYAGPHFQGLELVPGALAHARGRVQYAPAFAEEF